MREQYRWNVAAGIAVNDVGEVYVTGSTPNGSTGYDYLTVKYNSGGQQVGLQMYSGSANSNDFERFAGGMNSPR